MGKVFSTLDLKLAGIIGALLGIFATKLLPILNDLSFPYLIVTMFIGSIVLDLKLIRELTLDKSF